MATNETTTYIKIGRDGGVIEREALTPSDHAQFRGTGWVAKDSAAGKNVLSPKKTDVSKLTAAAVTAHAAAARATSSASEESSTSSSTKASSTSTKS